MAPWQLVPAPVAYYVAFNAIHGPAAAPPEVTAKYRRLLAAKPEAAADGGTDVIALRLAMLERMDTAIGRMLAALKRKGVLENTLVVFFSDNGGIGENPPFRGGKENTYEGGVRVPCLLHWPGHIPAGLQIGGIVHVVDLYPTLLKLAGGSPGQPLPVDGMDMWSAFIGKQPSPRTDVVLSLPGDDVGTGPMSIRRGSWKLVGKRLYNLADDPAETTDVVAQRPDIYRKLHQRIKRLVLERRPPEQHLAVPDRPLLVLGEDENAHPPEWLPAYVGALPERAQPRQRHE